MCRAMTSMSAANLRRHCRSRWCSCCVRSPPDPPPPPPHFSPAAPPSPSPRRLPAESSTPASSRPAAPSPLTHHWLVRPASSSPRCASPLDAAGCPLRSSSPMTLASQTSSA